MKFWETGYYSMLRDTTFNPSGWSDGELSEFHVLQEDFIAAERVDCTKLNVSFLLDTGAAREESMLAGEENTPPLPFDNALMQFGDMCCLVQNIENILVGDDAVEEVVFNVLSVKCWTYPYDNLPVINSPFAECLNKNDWSAYCAAIDDDSPYSPIVTVNTEAKDERSVKEAALMVLGVLTLMEERLLLQRTRQGARPATNMRREREGESAILTHKVLTMNLAETKRRTRDTTLRHHESPMLHWRRGHWRTLGRGSEFENRIWIKRMLVGDPLKGFVQKHYRMTWQPTIH